ncbi:MAG: DUF1565 domain-containing protein, partial [Polyangiaceae bacterium]
MKHGYVSLLFFVGAMTACQAGEEVSAIDQDVVGTTYYVSTSGNDANPGTSTQPWRTLQKAVDTIAPGDVALVRAGTYVGARIGKSGTATAPKTLKADVGARPILSAPGPSNAHKGIIELEN